MELVVQVTNTVKGAGVVIAVARGAVCAFMVWLCMCVDSLAR